VIIAVALTSPPKLTFPEALFICMRLSITTLAEPTVLFSSYLLVVNGLKYVMIILVEASPLNYWVALCREQDTKSGSMFLS